VATVSCGTTSERYQFIARNRELGVKYLCGWLKVSRGGFYDWRKREESERLKADKRLIQQITTIHQESRGTYGSPRVYQALKRQGIKVAQKRVERLMRENGLQGRMVTVTNRQPGLNRFKAAGDNLRLQAEAVTGINQQWVADVTYLKLNGIWFYLAVVMDLYSRRILGWSLANHRTTELTLAALSYAVRGRDLEGVKIFHTDRGIEYTAYKFRNAVEKHGFNSSFNRPGKCTDNAHMESFFHTLKAELIRGRVFQSEDELRYALNSYINQFYNHKRLHSGIGYHAPAEYERMAA